MSGTGLDLDTDPVWPRRPSRVRRWLAGQPVVTVERRELVLVVTDLVLLAALLVVLLW